MRLRESKIKYPSMDNSIGNRLAWYHRGSGFKSLQERGFMKKSDYKGYIDGSRAVSVSTVVYLLPNK